MQPNPSEFQLKSEKLRTEITVFLESKSVKNAVVLIHSPELQYRLFNVGNDPFINGVFMILYNQVAGDTNINIRQLYTY